MADRDRYDWDRGREENERDYGRGGDRDRGYGDRGPVSRGADEVRSWFGDDDARRRREMDEQRDHMRSERDYGANSERARREHGWGQQDQREPNWDAGRGVSHGPYGDQRDFIARSGGSEWTGSSQYSGRGREWQDRGYDDPQWRGGSRDFGDEDTSRRNSNYRYSGSGSMGGNYTAGQTNPSMSGGYGAGNYDSGNYRAQNAGPYGGYGGYGSQSSFGPRTSGWDNYGTSGTANYGRDFGTTGEGRWTNQQYGGGASSYGSGSYGGGSHAGRGPRNYQRSDDRIREDVNERLTADPRVDASDIDVRVQNGEVTLSGTVDERRTRRLAEEIIEDLPGVRDVRNELRVQNGRSGQQEHRQVGEQSRGHEDGAIGHTGNPQQRDDVTTVNVKDTGRK